MISSRYSIPVIFLLVIAIIPTIIHNYLGATIKDGKSVHDIPSIFKDHISTPTKRYSQWGKDIFDSEEWVERNYVNTKQTKIRLFVARSYNHKRLYHHPELALSYGQNLGNKKIINILGSPEIPVHILTNNDQSKLIAYILLYDDKFIKRPIMNQLSNSVRLLFNPRKQMTLFYVSQSTSPSTSFFKESAAASLLLSVIQSFRSQ